ncbi:hypothetical protein pb186bvf_008246 [Paramecium bursaria]
MDYQSVKICIVGDQNVGKTSMVLKYLKSPHYLPKDFGNYQTQVSVDSKNINLNLWDTASHENGLTLYGQADIFIIVFSVIDQNSFDEALNKWFGELNSDGLKKVPKIIVGNKIDMRNNEDPKHIKSEPARQVVQQNCPYFECSATTQEGLKPLFEQAIREASKYQTRLINLYFAILKQLYFILIFSTKKQSVQLINNLYIKISSLYKMIQLLLHEQIIELNLLKQKLWQYYSIPIILSQKYITNIFRIVTSFQVLNWSQYRVCSLLLKLQSYYLINSGEYLTLRGQMDPNSEPMTIKLLAVGDATRRDILLAYMSKKPIKYFDSPQVFEDQSILVFVDKKQLNLSLSDGAGGEKYNRLRTLSYQFVDIFILVFSLIDQNSFEDALNKFTEINDNERKNIQKIIVGSKLDERRIEDPKHIKSDAARQIVEKMCPYFECSALTYQGIEPLFDFAIREGLKQKENSSKEKEETLYYLMKKNQQITSLYLFLSFFQSLSYSVYNFIYQIQTYKYLMKIRKLSEYFIKKYVKMIK